jgi:hypothetical protein
MFTINNTNLPLALDTHHNKITCNGFFMNYIVSKEIAISFIISKIVEIVLACCKTTTHLTKKIYLITIDLNHCLHNPTLQLFIHHLQNR